MTGTLRRRSYRTRFVITFSAEGGTASAVSLKTGGDGKLDTLPTATRSGYTFLGWFRSDGAQVTTETVFTADETVYAHWQSQLVTVTVTGSGRSDNNTTYASVTIGSTYTNGDPLGATKTYSVEPGTVIVCETTAQYPVYSGIYLNGAKVASAKYYETATYSYTVRGNVSIYMYVGYGSGVNYGEIRITE